ncbi:hypothetical protein BURCE16_09165 [Burkholderia cepacia]|nr:hypothetical protein BURCE16_09165 [Burkholderia cepacia]
MPAGPRVNTRAGSRCDGHSTCRRPASHRRCHGARPRRRTTRPMPRPPPAPDCAPPHAASRSRPDRGASRDRGLVRAREGVRVGSRLRRQAFHLADAKCPPYSKTPASSCATPQPRRIVSSMTRRPRHRARSRRARFARRQARPPRASAARESARRAARAGAAPRRSGLPPSTPAAARTIRAGESIRMRRQPARRCATGAAPPRRQAAMAMRQSGSPTPSSLNASRSPGWQSR